MKLSHTTLRSLVKKPGGFSDGGGLYFRVRSDGAANWLSFGLYPEVSLANARLKHAALRGRLISAGTHLVERGKIKLETLTRALLAKAGPRLSRAICPGMTHLYRHYGADGQLLCVGVIANVMGRWAKYKRSSPAWADAVASITVEHFPTKEDAEKAARAGRFPGLNRKRKAMEPRPTVKGILAHSGEIRRQMREENTRNTFVFNG
jgi:hypothetical protein